MALNKTILNKLAEHTCQEPELRAFLLDVFQYEISPKNSWYTDAYQELLERHSEEGRACD